MRILPKPLSFQWDPGNTEKNLTKHSVSSQEAEEVFAAKPFITHQDIIHSSEKEQRFQGLGQTKSGRKLFVAFTIRERKIRVISIRDMKKKERISYERFEADT